jgi:hypothetical protein
LLRHSRAHQNQCEQQIQNAFRNEGRASHECASGDYGFANRTS